MGIATTPSALFVVMCGVHVAIVALVNAAVHRLILQRNNIRLLLRVGVAAP